MTSREAMDPLAAEASALYRAADRFAYYAARGKLRRDPAFAAILERGWLLDCKRILDLGCGQGLLAALLLTARSRYARGSPWPEHWPAAPQPASVRGVERNERAVRRGRAALGERAEFVVGDITGTDFGIADGIVILDVLHYIDYRSQEGVLARARAALAARGVLLLRVADAEGGIRFQIGQSLDRLVLMARERRAPKLYCRPLIEWRGMLAAADFDAETLPMSAGTPFANTMLVARPR